jgi:hypothetical protein
MEKTDITPLEELKMLPILLPPGHIHKAKFLPIRKSHQAWYRKFLHTECSQAFLHSFHFFLSLSLSSPSLMLEAAAVAAR